MTLLDPHDFQQHELTFPASAYRDNTTFAGLDLTGMPEIPYGDFADPQVKVWENVDFVDCYWQSVSLEGQLTLGMLEKPIINGRPLSDPAGIDADLTSAYADVELELNRLAGFLSDNPSGDPHSRVLAWYAGTVALDVHDFAGRTIVRTAQDAFLYGAEGGEPWWYGGDGADASGYDSPREGIGMGWAHSRLGGGPRPTVPASSTSKTPVTEDNTVHAAMDVPVASVFNGTFDATLRPDYGRQPVPMNVVGALLANPGSVLSSVLHMTPSLVTAHKKLEKVGHVQLLGYLVQSADDMVSVITDKIAYDLDWLSQTMMDVQSLQVALYQYLDALPDAMAKLLPADAKEDLNAWAGQLAGGLVGKIGSAMNPSWREVAGWSFHGGSGGLTQGNNLVPIIDDAFKDLLNDFLADASDDTSLDVTKLGAAIDALVGMSSPPVSLANALLAEVGLSFGSLTTQYSLLMTGAIQQGLVDYTLQLSPMNPSITHNLLLVPNGAEALEFELQVGQAIPGDRLNVYIYDPAVHTNPTPLADMALTKTEDGFELQSVAIPDSLRGKPAVIRFEMAFFEQNVSSSKVLLDDVRFASAGGGTRSELIPQVATPVPSQDQATHRGEELVRSGEGEVGLETLALDSYPLYANPFLTDLNAADPLTGRLLAADRYDGLGSFLSIYSSAAPTAHRLVGTEGVPGDGYTSIADGGGRRADAAQSWFKPEGLDRFGSGTTSITSALAPFMGLDAHRAVNILSGTGEATDSVRFTDGAVGGEQLLGNTDVQRTILGALGIWGGDEAVQAPATAPGGGASFGDPGLGIDDILELRSPQIDGSLTITIGGATSTVTVDGHVDIAADGVAIFPDGATNELDGIIHAENVAGEVNLTTGAVHLEAATAGIDLGGGLRIVAGDAQTRQPGIEFTFDAASDHLATLRDLRIEADPGSELAGLPQGLDASVGEVSVLKTGFDLALAVQAETAALGLAANPVWSSENAELTVDLSVRRDADLSVTVDVGFAADSGALFPEAGDEALTITLSDDDPDDDVPALSGSLAIDSATGAYTFDVDVRELTAAVGGVLTVRGQPDPDSGAAAVALTYDSQAAPTDELFRLATVTAAVDAAALGRGQIAAAGTNFAVTHGGRVSLDAVDFTFPDAPDFGLSGILPMSARRLRVELPDEPGTTFERFAMSATVALNTSFFDKLESGLGEQAELTASMLTDGVSVDLLSAAEIDFGIAVDSFAAGQFRLLGVGEITLDVTGLQAGTATFGGSVTLGRIDGDGVLRNVTGRDAQVWGELSLTDWDQLAEGASASIAAAGSLSLGGRGGELELDAALTVATKNGSAEMGFGLDIAVSSSPFDVTVIARFSEFTVRDVVLDLSPVMVVTVGRFSVLDPEPHGGVAAELADVEVEFLVFREQMGTVTVGDAQLTERNGVKGLAAGIELDWAALGTQDATVLKLVSVTITVDLEASFDLSASSISSFAVTGGTIHFAVGQAVLFPHNHNSSDNLISAAVTGFQAQFDFGTAPRAAALVFHAGEPFTDSEEDPNGRWDAGDAYTDLDGDGQYTDGGVDLTVGDLLEVSASGVAFDSRTGAASVSTFGVKVRQFADDMTPLVTGTGLTIDATGIAINSFHADIAPVSCALLSVSGLELDIEGYDDAPARFTWGGADFSFDGSISLSAGEVELLPTLQEGGVASGTGLEVTFSSDGVSAWTAQELTAILKDVLELSFGDVTVDLSADAADIVTVTGGITATVPLLTGDGATVTLEGGIAIDRNGTFRFQQDNATLDFDVGAIAETLGLAGVLPIDLTFLALQFNDRTDLSDLDLIVKANLSDDFVAYCGEIGFTPLLKIGDAESDIELKLQLPDLASPERLLFFKGTPEITLGFEDWHIGEELVLDAQISLGRFDEDGVLQKLAGAAHQVEGHVAFDFDHADSRIAPLADTAIPAEFDGGMPAGENPLDINGGALTLGGSLAEHGDSTVLRVDVEAGLDLRLKLADLIELYGLGFAFFVELTTAPTQNGGLATALDFGLNEVSVGGVRLAFGDAFSFTTTNATFRFNRENAADPVASFETMSVNFPRLDVGLAVHNLTILPGGRPDVTAEGFAVELDSGFIGELSEGFDWLPIRVDEFGFRFHGQPRNEDGELVDAKEGPNANNGKFDDGFFELDAAGEIVGIARPEAISLIFSGGFENEFTIGTGDSAERVNLPFGGSIKGLELDIEALAAGEFPIKNFDEIAIQLDPFALIPSDDVPFTIRGELAFGQVLGDPDDPNSNRIIYGRVKGDFKLSEGIGAGIDLIICERGPLLAKVTAPLGIPLGPTSLVLTEVEGGIAFGAVELRSVERPMELVTDPLFFDPFEIDSEKIRVQLQKLLERDEYDDQDNLIGRTFTWNESFAVSLSGTITTVASPGILTGEVSVGLSLQYGETNPGLYVFGSGNVSVFGMPLGRAGLMFDFSNALAPKVDMAFVAPAPGNPLGFLFPARAEFELQLRTDGLAEAPVIGMRAFMDSLDNSLLEELAARLEADRLAYREAVDAGRGWPLRPLTAFLLDTDADGRGDSRPAGEEEGSYEADQAITKECLLGRVHALIPESLESVAADPEPVVRFANALMLEVSEVVGQLKTTEQAKALLEDMGGTMVSALYDALFDAAGAIWEGFNPSLMITGNIQPTIFGFPMGEPTDEVMLIINKEQVSFGLRTSIIGQMYRSAAMMASTVAGPAALLLGEVMPRQIEDRLQLAFTLDLPDELITGLISAGRAIQPLNTDEGTPSGENGEESETTVDLGQLMLDSINPFSKWEVLVDGEILMFGFRLGGVSGIMFGPQPGQASSEGGEVVYDPIGLAQFVYDLDPDNTGTPDSARVATADNDASLIPVSRHEHYQNIMKYGGVLLTGQLFLPAILRDPVAVFDSIDWEAPEAKIGDLAEAGESITAFTDWINQIVEDLTADQEWARIQMYIPFPSGLFDLGTYVDDDEVVHENAGYLNAYGPDESAEMPETLHETKGDPDDANWVEAPSEPFTDANGNGVYDEGEEYHDLDGDGVCFPGGWFVDKGDGRYSENEAFTDTNGNGRYDAPEYFIDDDEDGEWDGGDAFIDRNNNGSYDSDVDELIDLDGTDGKSGELFMDRNGDGTCNPGEDFVDHGNGRFDGVYDGDGAQPPAPRVKVKDNLTDAVVDELVATLNAFYIEGYVDAKLFGIDFGKAYVGASTRGIHVETTIPWAGTDVRAEIGLRTLDFVDVMDDLLASPLVTAVISAGAGGLAAPDILAALETACDNAHENLGPIPVAFPVAAFEASIDSGKVGEWIETSFGIPSQILAAVSGGGGTEADAFLGIYTPGYGDPATTPEGDNIQVTGGIRLHARADIPGLIENADFSFDVSFFGLPGDGGYDAASCEIGGAGLIGPTDFIADFHAKASVDQLGGGLSGPGLIELHGLDGAEAAVFELKKEGGQLSATLSGKLVLLDSLALSVDGAFVVNAKEDTATDVGAEDIGFYGQISMGTDALSNTGYTLDADFRLHVNTTGRAQTLHARQLPRGVGIAADGDLQLSPGGLGSFRLAGAFLLRGNGEQLTLDCFAELDLGSYFGAFTTSSSAVIGDDGIQADLSFSKAGGDDPLFGLTNASDHAPAIFSLSVDTTEGAVVFGMQNVRVTIAGVELTGSILAACSSSGRVTVTVPEGQALRLGADWYDWLGVEVEFHGSFGANVDPLNPDVAADMIGSVDLDIGDPEEDLLAVALDVSLAIETSEEGIALGASCEGSLYWLNNRLAGMAATLTTGGALTASGRLFGVDFGPVYIDLNRDLIGQIDQIHDPSNIAGTGTVPRIPVVMILVSAKDSNQVEWKTTVESGAAGPVRTGYATLSESAAANLRIDAVNLPQGKSITLRAAPVDNVPDELARVGKATEGQDYAPLESATVTLTGDSQRRGSGVLTVSLLNDSVFELIEHFALALRVENAGGLDLRLQTARVRYFIVDDDPDRPEGAIVFYDFDEPPDPGSPDAGYSFTSRPSPPVDAMLTVSDFSHSSQRRSGRYGLDFDGVDDAIRAEIAGGYPQGAFTVEFWMKPDSVSGYARPFGLGTDSGNGIYLHPNTGTVNVKFIDGASRLEPALGAYSLGTWQHVAVTYDGERVAGYLNGVRTLQPQAWAGTLAFPDNAFFMGARSWDHSFFDGSLDEVRLWSVALSEGQIAAHMNSTLTGNEDDLVAVWSMDEGAGAVANDSVGAQNASFSSTSSRHPSWVSEAPAGIEPAHSLDGLPKPGIGGPAADQSPAIVGHRQKGQESHFEFRVTRQAATHDMSRSTRTLQQADAYSIWSRLVLRRLSFWERADTGGPTGWELRSSLDNFGEVLASGETSRQTFGFHEVALPPHFANIWSPDEINVTFRIYARGDAATAGVGGIESGWALDNVALSGEVPDGDIPPSTENPIFEKGIAQGGRLSFNLIEEAGWGHEDEDKLQLLKLVPDGFIGPDNGSVGIPAGTFDRTISYTPNDGFTGTDEIWYQVTDGTSRVSALLRVNVHPPPAVNDDAFAVWEGQTKTIAAPGLLANDGGHGGTLRLDTESLVKVQPIGSGFLGDLSVYENGAMMYRAADGGRGYTATFTYEAVSTFADGAETRSDPATVVITVKPVNAANVVIYLSTLEEPTQLRLEDVVPEGVSAALADVSAEYLIGSLVEEQNKCYYVPPGGANALDTSFEYNLRTSWGLTRTGTVALKYPNPRIRQTEDGTNRDDIKTGGERQPRRALWPRSTRNDGLVYDCRANLTNEGAFRAHGAPIRINLLEPDLVFANKGLIQVLDGQHFSVDGGRFTNEDDGRIEGIGSIDVAQTVFTNCATVVPGDGGGSLIVDGDYSCESTAVLQVDILGSPGTPGSHGQLEVTGAAELAGRLQLVIAETYTPQAGDLFDILRADSVADTFDDVGDLRLGDGFYFEVVQSDTAVQLLLRQLTATVPDAVTEGSPFTWAGALDKASAFATEVRIHWGDGVSDAWPVDPDRASAEAEHSYEDDGVYEVSVDLVAADGGEMAGLLQHTIAVDNSAPAVTAMSADPPLVGPGEPTVLTGPAVDPGRDQVRYTWDFGDDSEPVSDLNQVTVSHAYAQAGDYTVTLTVADEDGGSASETLQVSVVAEDDLVDSACAELTLGDALVEGDTARFDITLHISGAGPEDVLTAFVLSVRGSHPLLTGGGMSYERFEYEPNPDVLAGWTAAEAISADDDTPGIGAFEAGDGTQSLPLAQDEPYRLGRLTVDLAGLDPNLPLHVTLAEADFVGQTDLSGTVAGVQTGFADGVSGRDLGVLDVSPDGGVRFFSASPELELTMPGPLTVSEGGAHTVTAAELTVSGDGAADQIVYVLETPPGEGTLIRGQEALSIGDSFTQQDIQDRLLRYAHDGSEKHMDAFDCIAVDATTGGALAVSVQITVLSQNDAPTAVDDLLQLSPSAAETVCDVLGNDSDVEGDEISLVSLGDPEQGVARIVDGQIRYQAAADFCGEDSVIYTIQDAHGAESTGVLHIEVGRHAAIPLHPGWNLISVPVVLPDPRVEIVLAGLAVDATVWTFDNRQYLPVAELQPGTGYWVHLDRESAPLQLDLWGRQPSGGGRAVGKGWCLYGTSQNRFGEVDVHDDLWYWNAPEQIYRRAGKDDWIESGRALWVFSLKDTTLYSENTRPVAGNDATEIPANSEDQQIPVTANDRDADGDALCVVSLESPIHGTAGIEDGQVWYRPESGFVGVDTFEYTVSDGKGGRARARVSITVRTVNSPPVAQDDVLFIEVGEKELRLDVLANDSCMENSAERPVVSAVGKPAQGSARVIDGSVYYTAGAGFAGEDAFTYTITDSTGIPATGRVTIKPPAEIELHAGWNFFSLPVRPVAPEARRLLRMLDADVLWRMRANRWLPAQTLHPLRGYAVRLTEEAAAAHPVLRVEGWAVDEPSAALAAGWNAAGVAAEMSVSTLSPAVADAWYWDWRLERQVKLLSDGMLLSGEVYWLFASAATFVNLG